MTSLKIELGFVSLAELAQALDEPYDNVRSWNSRDSVPDAARPKIDALRAERAAAKPKRNPRKP